MGKSKREQSLSMIIKEKKKIIDNDNNDKPKKATAVDITADALVSKFNAPASRPFFCKCAWHLSEDEIWTIFETANRPGIKSPIRYFVASCSNLMNKRA